jgi:hypothetical protein
MHEGRPNRTFPLAALRWLMGYDGVPLLSRPSLRYELISAVLAFSGLGVVMHPFTQLFARKSLAAPSWVLALLLAELAAGNFWGTFLGQYLQRRRRVPCVVAARIAIAAVLATIACLPVGPASAYLYAGLLMLPALLLAICLNVESSIWHANYGEGVRGRIFGRLLVARMGAAAMAIRLAGFALDCWPGAHHVIHAVSAALVLASALIYAKVRVRRERAMLREGTRRPIRLLAGLRLLRSDPSFGRFMLWQMLSGSAVLVTVPVIVLVLTEPKYLDVDYDRGTTALALVPLLMAVLTTPLFGRLFDRIAITQFRAINAALWAVSRIVLFAAVMGGCWPCVLVAFAVQGCGQSSGGIGFHIGHTRFSHPARSQLYMGIHMTLMGLRGMTMPFVGVWLYEAGLVGVNLLILAAAAQFVAAAGFLLMRAPATPQAPARSRSETP